MHKDKYSSGDGYMYVYLLSIVACVVVAIVVALMIFGSGLFLNDSSVSPAPPVVNTSGSQSGADVSSETSEVSGPSRFSSCTVDNSEVNVGLLLLVNSDNRYVFPEENETVSLYSLLKNSSVSLSGTSVRLNSTAANALKSMCEAFYSESGLTTGIMVYNGYYSYDTVADKDGADAAGASDYHIGNTARLMVYPTKLGKIGVGDFEWFIHNCYSYGFILRYPADKSDLTGNEGSLGVYRYVGVCHAYYMYKNNLCLEEYLELLKQYTPENPLIIDVQNKSYEVYYQAMEDGLSSAVQVPADGSYIISGNNCDGFIITVTG